MSPLPVPPASDGPERLADWAELTALGSADRNISFQDIAEELRRAGTSDALIEDPETAAEEVDQRAEAMEGVVDAVFTEFDERARAGAPGYPFQVEGQVLQGPQRRFDSTYVFLLLLARFGKDAGPRSEKGLRAEQLFEDVCARAFTSYLGGEESVELLRIGYPRTGSGMPAGFRDAVNEFCDRFGEGGRASNNPRVATQNDGRLDLIAWAPFPDGRAGKVIGYGQCSTSADWMGHLILNPRSFNKLWIRYPLESECLLFSFFPQRIESDKWSEVVVHGGIPFDRCRVARHASSLRPELRRRCASWAKLVFESEDP